MESTWIQTNFWRMCNFLQISVNIKLHQWYKCSKSMSDHQAIQVKKKKDGSDSFFEWFKSDKFLTRWNSTVFHLITLSNSTSVQINFQFKIILNQFFKWPCQSTHSQLISSENSSEFFNQFIRSTSENFDLLRQYKSKIKIPELKYLFLLSVFFD